jgi:hypothetical protein
MSSWFLFIEAEVAEGEDLAIGADFMTVCAGKRIQSLDGANGRDDAQLCDGNVEFGIRLTGDDDDGPTVRDAGNDGDRRPVDLAYRRAIDPSGLGCVHGTIEAFQPCRSRPSGMSNSVIRKPYAAPTGRALMSAPFKDTVSVPVSGSTETEDSVPRRKRAFASACLRVT